MEPAKSVVLIDAPDGTAAFDKDLLERMGHEVVMCHGPDHKELCPILRKGGHCTIFEGAHGVVFELDLDRPQHRAILRRYQDIVKDGVPIRALVQPDQAERYADLLDGVEVWNYEPSAGDLDAFSARVGAQQQSAE